MSDRVDTGARWKAEVFTSAALWLFACLLYLPGTQWGLPAGSQPDQVFAAGSDELAPMGPLAETYNLFVADEPVYNPQYAYFHYGVQLAFMAPYLLGLRLGGRFVPEPSFPYGFSEPELGLAMITWLARLSSVAFAAGSVVAAFWLGRILWDRRAGLFTALLTALFYPHFYYGRTSNVDGPALFWAIVGLTTTATILRSGLTLRRGLMLGVVAAIGVATKDANYLPFAAMAAVLVIAQIGRSGLAAGVAASWRPLAAGGLASIATYAVASGLVFSLERFEAHVDWMMHTRAAFQYPATLAGQGLLAKEAFGHWLAALSVPVAIAAAAGAVLRIRQGHARDLWVLLPGVAIYLGTIPLVHFINFRYIILVAFVALPFAAFALSWWTRAESRFRVVGWLLVVICVGWCLLRAGDLTYQMRNDPRADVAAFLAEQARPGDRIGYWGSRQKLPSLPPGVTPVALEAVCTVAELEALAPAFVLTIPQQHFEVDHSWTAGPELARALESGGTAYRLAMDVQTRTVQTRRPVPFVNPPVRLYALDESIAGTRPRLRPSALLAGVESWLGITGPPKGLVRSIHDRGPCEAPR